MICTAGEASFRLADKYQHQMRLSRRTKHTSLTTPPGADCRSGLSGGIFAPRVYSGYAAGITLVLVTSLALRLLEPSPSIGRLHMPFTFAVTAVAYLFGPGPALLAFLLSVASFMHPAILPIGGLSADGACGDAGTGLTLLIAGSLTGGTAGLLVRRSRRRVEDLAEMLKASNERTTTIFESITDAFFAVDYQWRFTYMNHEAERILDRTRGELIGRVLWDEYPDAVGSRFYTEYHRAAEEGVTVSFREFYPPLGMWFEVRAYPSAQGLSVYFRDITRTTKIEEDLRDSRESLALATAAADIGTWYWDLERDILSWDAKCKALFGIPLGTRVTYGVFLNTLHPDDREKTHLAARRAVDEHKEYDTEFRIVWPDGSLHWIRAKGRGFCDENGEPVRMVGVAIDITEQKEAQEALRQEQETRLQFYRRVIEAATHGKLVICESSAIERVAGPAQAEWRITEAADLPDIRHEIHGFLRTQGMDDARVDKLITCMGESATNAIKHANGGTVSVHRSRDSVLLVVSDNGTGIAELNIPDVALRPGYTTAGTLGMGYKVMICYADKVYLATGNDGTTIAIEMSLDPLKADVLADYESLASWT